MSVFQGARIELKQPQPQDHGRIVELWTNPKVRQFLGGVVPIEKAVATADRLVSLPPDSNVWTIKLIYEPSFLGLVSINGHHDGEAMEVSYQLLPEFHSQGFATEAVGLAIDFARSRLNLKQLLAETQAANLSSCRLLERLGFVIKCELVRFGSVQKLYVKSL